MSESENVDITNAACWYKNFQCTFPKNPPTQSVIFRGDLVFCGKLRVCSSVCPRLSSVQSHISWRHVPPSAEREPSESSKQTAHRSTERERHVAGAPQGSEGDYGGLRPSLILHFSSPQHLLSFPMSCQNRESFHPKISITLQPRLFISFLKM